MSNDNVHDARKLEHACTMYPHALSYFELTVSYTNSCVF